MNEKIEIEVKYSSDEYVRGMIFSQRKNSSHKYSFIIAFVSIIIGTVSVYYFTNSDEISWDSELLLKSLLFLIIIIPIAYALKDFSYFSERVIKKHYDTTKLLQETYQIRFDSDGINSESNSFTNTLRWNAVIETVQTHKDLHFFIGRNASLFIPKRVFTDEQQNEVKNLSKMKLGDKAKF